MRLSRPPHARNLTLLSALALAPTPAALAQPNFLPSAFDPRVEYATLMTGMQWMRAQAIALDADGNAWVVGHTMAPDFPVSADAFDPFLGPEPMDGQVGTVSAPDAFVARLDPTGRIVYATYLGGTDREFAWDVAVDADGCAYVVGQTYSLDFPTTDGALSTEPFNNGSPIVGEGFLTKFDPAGRVVYSTFIGDANRLIEPETPQFGTVTASDACLGVAVDLFGNAYVVGETYSPLFPVTDDAFDPYFGDEPMEGQVGGVSAAEGFVCRVNAAGTEFLYSSYLGGGLADYATAVAVDADGNAYVTGETHSATFPTTPGAFRAAAFDNRPAGADGDRVGDAFVTKVNPSGTELVYSTYLGDGDEDREPDPRYGNVSGRDFGTGIAIDGDGNAYVVGASFSPFFPTTENAVDRTRDTPGQDGQYGDIASADAFIVKLDPAGANLLYSSYLGGRGTEFGNDVALDPAGRIVVVGSTSAFEEFPETPNFIPKQRYFNASITDCFVTALSNNGERIEYSVRFGGASSDDAQGIAIDAEGYAYIAGYTFSEPFLDPNYDPSSEFFLVDTFSNLPADSYVLKIATPGVPTSLLDNVLVDDTPLSEDGVLLDGPLPVGACPMSAMLTFALSFAGMAATRRRRA